MQKHGSKEKTGFMEKETETKYEVERQGHDFERLKPMCSRKHRMKVSRGQPFGYNGS